MQHACTICGAPSPNRRCPTHDGTHTGWSPDRNRATQAHFRRTVLERAGHQCQAIENGQRCPATTRLQAHHTIPGLNDPATGIAFCVTHHRAADRHAR